MGSTCSSGGCGSDDRFDSERYSVDVSRLDLSSINILEFENRVKRYAHPINRGKVSVDQLYQAFNDLPIFKQLKNPFSIVYKLLLSPFFREIPLTHYQRKEEPLLKDAYILSEAGLSASV